MIKYFSIFLLALCFTVKVSCQMHIGTDTLYGNEWIQQNQTYFKFSISEDKLYRINFATLTQAGIPLNSIKGENFQLYRMGQQVPIFTTTDSTFAENDFIEFYGKRMRSELDSFMYDNPKNEMLNPDYSLINDTISYYLTWSNKAGNKRIKDVGNNLSVPSDTITKAQTDLLFSFPNARIKPGGVYTGVNSRLDPGEGYGASLAKTFNTNLNIPAISGAADSVKINIRVYFDEGTHNLDFKLNDQLVYSKSAQGYALFDTSFVVEASLLKSNNTLLVADTDPNPYGFSISNIHVNYLRDFSFSGLAQYRFELQKHSNPNFIEATGFFQGGGLPILYDLTSNRRQVGFVENSQAKFSIPLSNTDDEILLHSGATIGSINSLQAIQFVDYFNKNADYVIISHPSLYNDGKGNNYVQQYADYRASEEGGSHNVLVVNIQELYDQFAFGNDRNFISIRNFAHFIQKKWPAAKSIFLIGKGREYAYVRSAGNLVNPTNQSFYIPTFGTPGSDNLLVVTQGQIAPILALGRIAAQNGQDIADYLQKMKDFEANGKGNQSKADQLWKKDVIHLGGGSKKSEQLSFKLLLENIATTIEQGKVGAHVTGFYKTNTDPIQVSQNQQIFDEINNGVSIITFLGHSAVGTFDFSIDNPQNYLNYGKYPLMFSLGCYSGNYNTSAKGTGENFCFYKDKGALGFLATSYTGYPSILTQFTNEFYKLQGGDKYGASVGDILKSTYAELANTGSTYIRALTEQMSYHGDPEFTLHVAEGPDYTPDISSLQLEPKVVTVETDSIQLSFDVLNLGTNTKDSLQIRIQQKLPGGEIRVLQFLNIPAPGYKTNISLKLPSFKKDAFGQNTLLVDVDENNKIAEFPSPEAENNNSISQNGKAGFDFYVTDNSAIPVSPDQYAIVPKADFTLVASTADPFSKQNDYLIQLDTTKYFNSPLLASKKISQKGGLIKWQPNTLMLDSTVYYWRITPDSSKTGVGAIWQTSSFFYRLASNLGSSIAHNFQFNEGFLNNLKPIGTDQKMNFITDVKDVFVQNFLRKPEYYPAYYINNGLAEINYGNDILAGVYVGVIDPITGEQWLNPKGGQYGSETPADWRIRGAYPYTTSKPEKRKALISFLKDTIPDGNYVVFFTIQDANNSYKPEDWAIDSIDLGTNIFQVLEGQGAKLIRNTVGNVVPYSFVYRKGVKALGESIAASVNDVANLNVGIEGTWDRGSFTSKIIGPSKSWKNLHWKIQEDKSGGDSSSIKIFGLQNPKSTPFLLKNITDSYDIDLSDVDPKIYPYLQYNVFLKDSINKTSPNLNYVRVYYDPVTELAVNPSQSFVFHADTLDQGDVLKWVLPVENISQVNSDSILVKYTLTAPDKTQEITFKKEQALNANTNSLFGFDKNTLQLKGEYQLDVEINAGMLQPENYYFNNLASLRFVVRPDIRNPLLNVAFDGVSILDGDIVSAKPEITIELKDENKYISLSDTSVFKIFLKYPNYNDYLPISISSSEIAFMPATGTGKNNKARIIFRPQALQNGEHSLLVQARDESGNQSGSTDYKVRFNVITEKTVSSFLPYPNPFTSSTCFVYTLTGDQSPEHVRIRIYSVSGQLVKEITEQDLGILKIGTHQTDYRWDGTDMYGNRLGNGVYLYQVIIKNNAGQNWDSYQSKADNFMDRGFGKIVILR